MRTRVAEIREPEHNMSVELSDEELEHVVGGLNRVWTPFTNTHTGVASPAPRQDPGAVVDATAREP